MRSPYFASPLCSAPTVRYINFADEIVSRPAAAAEQKLKRMLTIFAVPKAFQGHTGIIQLNAIRSWSRLAEGCEIILCGDDPGTEEAAAEVGAKYIPDIARNEYGTPLLDSIFARAAEEASNELLCYVNADIILLRDFVEAIGRIPFETFLMVGRRWNVDITEPLSYTQPDWEKRLRAHVAGHGELFSQFGIDYFAFPRKSGMAELPPFAVGRPGWDNWFIYNARMRAFPVIDATRAVTVIHQNHGYAHVPKQKGAGWEGPEADANREIIGGWERFFNIDDATHIMTQGGLRRARELQHLRRRWQTLPAFVPAAAPTMRLLRAAGYYLRVWERFGNSHKA